MIATDIQICTLKVRNPPTYGHRLVTCGSGSTGDLEAIGAVQHVYIVSSKFASGTSHK